MCGLVGRILRWVAFPHCELEWQLKWSKIWSCKAAKQTITVWFYFLFLTINLVLQSLQSLRLEWYPQYPPWWIKYIMSTLLVRDLNTSTSECSHRIVRYTVFCGVLCSCWYHDRATITSKIKLQECSGPCFDTAAQRQLAPIWWWTCINLFRSPSNSFQTYDHACNQGSLHGELVMY